ncbi:MAG: prepilin peptidase [bacterium]|nr:prepilin peptidase [bacterium]
MLEAAVNIALFILGTAIGSFLNVLAFRFSEKSGFGPAMKGRSKCPHCSKVLTWSELVPILSFLIQGGECRGCKGRISLVYLTVEFLAGLIAVFVPIHLSFGVPALIWVLVLWTLLLISAIDLRLGLIPNGLVALVAALGGTLFAYRYFSGYFETFIGSKTASYIGHYYLTFSVGESVLINHLLAIGFGLALFGGVYLLSKGKAMGLGDVKLAGALGTLLVLPDMVLAVALAFIVGSLAGIIMMKFGKLQFKSSVPFGPFLAIGVTFVLFFGYDIVDAYFKLFGII